MSRKRSFRQKLKAFGSNIGSTENEFVKGVVSDVITDNEHPLVEDGTIPFGRIGYIRFVPMGALFMSADNGFFAAPFDKIGMTTIKIWQEAGQPSISHRPCQPHIIPQFEHIWLGTIFVDKIAGILE